MGWLARGWLLLILLLAQLFGLPGVNLLGLDLPGVDLPGIGLAGELVSQVTAKESKNPVNNQMNSTNLLFLWTERDRLKVITLMVINHDQKKAGIVNIPLASYYPGESERLTLGDSFQKEGRTGLVARLERYLGSPIRHRIVIEQQTLVKLSDVLGNFEVNGDNLNMAQAFYETSTALRSDDQDVVRAIAGKLIQPATLIKLPQLVWIMVREVQTDLEGKDIWYLFREFQGTDVGGLRKTALPGQEYIERGKRYREVPVAEWKRILVKVSG